MPMQRKTVTVVFCDVTGSTQLGESTDPEALRALLARYFERMNGIVEAHGGSVEKFIGDAVMAVFGVPAAHEDDALRACRAAVEMRDAFPELGISGRIGVNTGEVVTGTEERLATGDAVNVAARLEQAAQPGEALIGAETLGLVRTAVEIGDERKLELKGKTEPVPAWPLLAVSGEVERRFATPMVGRETELRRLRDAFEQAARDGSCQLFTVLGSAGVGKSRLAAEFLAGLDARVVRGRCLSYGEGITYWPVVEILKQLGTLPDGDAARPLRSVLGEPEIGAAPDEIAWGFRKLLEQEAQEQPLVCLLDDLHWGEETLLDLVEHVADLSRDAPLLLLCMARPELLERRPSWGGGKWNATTVLLEPLDAAETERLLAELGGVGDELRERIVRVAEGNPLFLEEMLALVRDSSGGEVEVPPTIQALLAARLDQLDPAERSVLERGSVEGRTFHRGAVAALSDSDGSVDQRLVALVRKELVRPERAQLTGDDAYRFRHLLIRDAAYEALPKATRADLHRRFAAWLEQHGRDLVELDEILGYHLEQAARYLAELGGDDRELALAAGERLGPAGVRAYWRGDPRAAAALLERALTLTRPYRLDIHLEAELAESLEMIDIARAVSVVDAATERAVAEGDETAAALGRVVAANLRLQIGECSADELERLARAALPLLEAREDDDGLHHAWQALGWAANMRSRLADWADALEQSLLHARRAGHAPAGSFVLSVPLSMGPMPAAEALAKLDSLTSDPPHPGDLTVRGLLLAMLGQMEEAWAIAVPADEKARELGIRGGEVWLGEIALIAGDRGAAAEYLRGGCEDMERRGATAQLSTYSALLGRVVCSLGAADEAERLARKGRELGDPEDVWTQALWRQAQALVHSARSEHGEAVRLAREAVELWSRTDALVRQAEGHCDLAEVLEAAGRPEEAIGVWREALECYERKGVLPLAAHVRERLATLEPASA
ncbi:MAG TPA: adenylate/guanylate cyclase domain-containing protein [Gaiellaceae bacterium]|nr:adenylate/guanylate cyclase domain-containing protein [Gaiellaceae bacterium]